MSYWPPPIYRDVALEFYRFIFQSEVIYPLIAPHQPLSE
jgi:hypothetical protein